jgi:hypothetical protein
LEDSFDFEGKVIAKNSIKIPAISMVILFEE